MLFQLFAYDSVGFDAVSKIENNAVEAFEEDEMSLWGV